MSHLFLWIAAAYVLAYIVLVDRAVKATRRLANDLDKEVDRSDPWGWKDSLSATRLMLDKSLPRDDFPDQVKKKIALSRFFFFTTPPVCFACWLLMVVYSE